MSKVYVKWYGKVLEGELLDGDYLGMKQVRIPLDGHHPVALFMPWSVYESAELAASSSPGKSPNIPRSFPELPENFQKSAEISEKAPVISKSDVLPADDREMIEAFKRDNWDQEHNHLRIDKLDEFYQLWRMVMTPVGFKEPVFKPLLIERDIDELAEEFKNYDGVIFNPDAKTTTILPAEAPVTLPSHKEKPVSADAVQELCTPKKPQSHKPDAITKGYSAITSPYPAITQPYSGKSQDPTKKMLRSTGVQQFKDSTQLALFE